jgi:phage baseplate assembly protein W
MTIRTAVYSDVDMELNRQNDGDIQRDIELHAVINSLENIISTIQGSRRMLPEFAMDIHKMLFEPLDDKTANMIGKRIIYAIQTWDNRVEIVKLDVDVNYDQNLYNMTLSFQIKPINEIISIDFILVAQ